MLIKYFQVLLLLVKRAQQFSPCPDGYPFALVKFLYFGIRSIKPPIHIRSAAAQSCIFKHRDHL